MSATKTTKTPLIHIPETPPPCPKKECVVCLEEKQSHPPFAQGVSITCFTCKHFTCMDCCEGIWKKEENETLERFGMSREWFKCPMCRAEFNRLNMPDGKTYT